MKPEGEEFSELNGVKGVKEVEGLAADRDGPSDVPECEVLREMAMRAGIKRVHFLAWRDLDDPEAGGSELHAHRIASQWAAAGIDVSFRTSSVPGRPVSVSRDGYRVRRKSGRYGVFATAAWEGRRDGVEEGDALVEVWNGMPFFSPLWYRGPRITFLHHVHAEMWGMVLPSFLAGMGTLIERRLAPPIYHRSRIVTLSESSRAEIVEMLGFAPSRVSVVPPGVEPRFSAGGERSKAPLVVAVGRLVPVKQFDQLIESLVLARKRCPELQAAIIGEGYERNRLEDLVDRYEAGEWLTLPGRVDDAEIVDWYRRAWVVASTSSREGWAMTLTEAAACGTPAVATDIAGHRDAVVDGQNGILAEGVFGIADALVEVLNDEKLRERFAKNALERSRWFRWERTARSTLQVLVDQVDEHSWTRDAL
jgi:glycosyltransferase involved in cell wall biosynthesis